MKKILCAGLSVFILAAIAVSVSFAGGHKVIDGKDLEVMMKNGKSIMLVDVREPELYSAGHIKGAVNIPYDTAKGRILKELSTNDRIVFVCHGGPMGDELSEILMKNGYKDVSNLNGGMKKWKGEIVK